MTSQDKQMECPSCKSTYIRQNAIFDDKSIPFTCGDCGEQFDYAKDNDINWTDKERLKVISHLSLLIIPMQSTRDATELSSIIEMLSSFGKNMINSNL